MRIKAKPVDLVLIQVYAPTNDASQTETDEFYSELENVAKLQKKYQDCLIVMGNFNGKVGDIKEDNIVGPFGLGQRNDNGQSVIDYCRKSNLMIANTWFQTKESNRYTWTAPDKKTRNQIDYILIDNRYRNGVKNSKARPGADCDSDHNLVIAHLEVKLQRIVRKKQEKITRWNTDLLKEGHSRRQFEDLAEKKFEHISDSVDINALWLRIKTSLTEVAEEVCGKRTQEYRQNWMNAEILQKMETRRQYKKDQSEFGQKRYKDLKHEVQKLCRQPQNQYYNNKCEEIEKLEATHNPLLYKKIKEMFPKKHTTTQLIKDKDGNFLYEPTKILERWAEYVEELYDDIRDDSTVDIVTQEMSIITELEVKSVIQKLSRNKATGSDNIPAEFLQSLGERGLQVITKLMNKIYNTGIIPDDFLQNIFITIPKVNGAQECSDYRTISLISHTSKILLQLINNRITPIIERHLSDRQMGFRKGKGTRDAIFQLRTISERAIQVNKNNICMLCGLSESI